MYVVLEMDPRENEDCVKTDSKKTHQKTSLPSVREAHQLCTLHNNSKRERRCGRAWQQIMLLSQEILCMHAWMLILKRSGSYDNELKALIEFVLFHFSGEKMAIS